MMSRSTIYVAETDSTRALCLSCEREDCPGDCRARKAAFNGPRGSNNGGGRRPAHPELAERYPPLHSRGLNDREAAEYLGVKQGCIYRLRHRLGLPANAGQATKGDTEVW